MRLFNTDQTEIIQLLKTQKVISVDTFTQKLRKPKTAIRRTLLALEVRGLVERVWIKAKRGRPSLSFRLSSNSNVLFPSKEAELLSELIKFLGHAGQGDLLEAFFLKYWEDRYNRVLEKLERHKCRDLSTRLMVLKEVLSEDGFYPRSNLSRKNDQVTLRECHCPISAVAAVTDLPCRLEAQLISKVLNGELVSAVPMSSKQEDCRFIITRKK